MRRLLMLFVVGCLASGCGGCKEDEENNGKAEPADSCDQVRCAENASCDDSGGFAVCSCRPGFDGDGYSCDEIVVACDDDSGCGDTGTCSGGFCECADGYALQENGCADADECGTNTDDCADDATCTNTPGGFICSCNEGWQGDGKSCTDYDECAAGVAECSAAHAACVNTEGGYDCGCESGYTGDGVTCSVLVDCNADPGACDANASCVDTADGTACVCDEGFAGDGATCRQTGFAVIHAGADKTCGLRRDGTMSCWGFQVPNGENTGLIYAAVEPRPLDDPNRIEWSFFGTGLNNNCLVLNDGTLWCFQNNQLNQVGPDSDWEYVSSNDEFRDAFYCAIKTSGTLWCWGNNDWGQLGLGPVNDSVTEPTQVGMDSDWAQVELGGEHACARKDDNSIWCWGDGGDGQLGGGSQSSDVPVKVGNQTDWEDLYIAGDESCARKDSGQVWCWGGRLRDGGPERIEPVTWKHFATYGGRNCGVRDNGTLWCRGGGLFGESGSENQYEQGFVQVGSDTDWAYISLGAAHSCGLKESGAAWCFGHNFLGQLGTGTFGIKMSPARVPGTGWSSAQSGQAHMCAIQGSGELFCSGSNIVGHAGFPRTVLHEQEPTRIGNSSNWSAVSGAIQHTCAVQRDGTLWCAGFNGGGQAGQPEGSMWQEGFQRVGADTDWASVDTGPIWGCGLKSDGALYCWGMNDGGQLGTGGIETVWTPTRIGTDTWSAVSTEGYLTNAGNTCAIRSADDSLWCWGANQFSELGDGTTDYALEPKETSDAQWKQIDTGGGFACGVQVNNTLWCWGHNQLGKTGTGSAEAIVAVPTQVGSDTDWASVSAGHNHACGLKTSGALYCWGDATGGMVGIGVPTTLGAVQPTQVGRDSNWAYVSANYVASFGIKTDGSLWAWGMNRDGQLATGDAWTHIPVPVWD